MICDFLRDLALQCEHVSQIPIVFLRPNVGVGARINQLGVYMDLVRVPVDTSLQHVRNIQCPPDLLRIPCATIFHDAGAADYFEVGYLGQLCQNAVLNAIGKQRALFAFAQIFKGQHSDSSCYWTVY